MTQIVKQEHYQIGSDRFVKEYLADGRVQFLKNGRPLDLETWNVELNRFQSMSVKEQHANPLVRWQEQQRRRGILHFVSGRAGEHVADVGCESGYLAAGLARQGCRVTCIDIDPTLLDLARQRLARQRIGKDRVAYVVSDIRQIQLPDASVDVALASEILEHLPDPQEGMRELIRITRPGGRIILSVPNESLVLGIKRVLNVLRLTRWLGGLSKDLAIGHVQIFDRATLRRLGQMQGVTIQRIQYHKPLFLNIFMRLKRESA